MTRQAAEAGRRIKCSTGYANNNDCCLLTFGPTVRCRKAHYRSVGGERMHLTDGDGVQPLEAFSLRQAHVDELGVQAFHVGEHEKLLHGSVVAYVALERRVRFAPLFGGLTEERDVEEIGFAGVGNGGLRGRDDGGNEVRLIASVWMR